MKQFLDAGVLLQYHGQFPEYVLMQLIKRNSQAQTGMVHSTKVIVMIFYMQ